MIVTAKRLKLEKVVPLSIEDLRYFYRLTCRVEKKDAHETGKGQEQR